MSTRARLIGLGVSAALVSGALVATTPAHAADTTIDYHCLRAGQVLPVPLLERAATVPLELGTLPGEVSLGSAVEQVTGSLGLTSLLDLLGGTLASLLGTVEGLVFTLDGVVREGSVSPTGTVTIPGFEALTQEGEYPLTAPDEFVMKSVGGLLGTVTCTLAETTNVVGTVVARAAGAVGGDPVGGDPVGGDPVGGDPVGGTPGGGEPAVPPTTAGPEKPAAAAAPNPCLTTPVATPGQKATRLTAKAKKRSWKKRPAVALRVTSRKKPARGTVLACYGALEIGQAKLKKGRATLRTVRFYPGRYRFRLVYLGSAKAKPKVKAVTVRVTR